MQQLGAKSDRDSIDIAVRDYLAPAASRAHARSEAGESAEAVFDRMLEEAMIAYSEDPNFHELLRGLAYSLPTDDRWVQVMRTKLREPANAATAIT